VADERRAARIAVLVGAGHVEVGGPWPHGPLADERLPLGSQSLSVVAALRSAGGLLRRGSGQLKVGLLVLGLARAGAAVQRTRKDWVTTGSRSWTSLMTTARTLSWSFMRLWPWCWRRWRILAQVLELALCQVRRPVTANRCWSSARRWSPTCCRWLSRPRLVPLTLLLELGGQLVLLDRTPL